MNYFKPFESEIHSVFMEAERRINLFPEPLNTQAKIYMDSFNPLKENSTNNYICYLLPYWMKDLTNVSDKQCQQLSLANVFLMLYFFIQDDVMDSEVGDRSIQLALGNLFHIEMHTILRALYDSSSPFWNYYHTYVTDWAKSVVNEKNDDYFNNDLLMVSKKSGPVKLASTGALLLSGDTDHIPVLEDMIEHILVSLQMADDWADWEEDLQEGSYNCFLALIRQSDTFADPLSIDTVKQYIYDKEMLSTYILKTNDNDKHIKSSGLPATNLFLFHNAIISGLTKQAEHIIIEKKTMFYGGIESLLFRYQ